MKIFQDSEALDQSEGRIVGARPMRMRDISTLLGEKYMRQWRLVARLSSVVTDLSREVLDSWAWWSEWRPLIGPELSRYWALIGGHLTVLASRSNVIKTHFKQVKCPKWHFTWRKVQNGDILLGLELQHLYGIKRAGFNYIWISDQCSGSNLFLIARDSGQISKEIQWEY